MRRTRKVIVVEAPTGQYLGFVDPKENDPPGCVMFCWVNEIDHAINFPGPEEAADIVMTINRVHPGAIMNGTVCASYMLTEELKYDA